VPDVPDVPAGAGEQRELLARMRAVVEAKDAENVVLRAELAAERELRRGLELKVAELERRLGQDSTNSGTPGSKEGIGARERRKAERKKQVSERERSKDRKRGGQPGHPGAGLKRDPDPDERKPADPPARCSRCGTGLGDARPAEPGWAQVWDVRFARFVTEWLLPARVRPCCGKVTTADAPPGTHAGTVSYGPGLNTAALLLTGYGNVPAERAADLIGMLTGIPVSAGFTDKASSRLDERLRQAGFDEAMRAALAAEPALGADETPVNVVTPEADPDTGEPAGAPHVLIVRPPGGKLTWLRALTSRRHEAITAILAFFTGFLIADGYGAYQKLGKLAGVQQCCQHIIRRCRQVAGLGPGSLQSWAADVIEVLRAAHKLVEEARARGDPAAVAQDLADLRGRYHEAVAFGITHNRHRDWHDGNHPGYTLATWLQDYARQVWLFTGEDSVDWTNNVSEQGAKAAKRHQAVSGYWQTHATLQRWCRIRSYLDSALAHGLTALDAITRALEGNPWLPPTTAAEPAAA
jgi:Transposase IS66 family